MNSQQQMWKRLETVAQIFQHRNIQYPLMSQEEWETREDLEAKLERWKAGEKVEGIVGEYEGGEVGILLPCRYVALGDV